MFRYKSSLKLIFVIIFVFSFLIGLSLNAKSLGLNYHTTEIIVKSGESFCIKDYFLFNTESKEMKGYLDVSGNLIRLTNYYNEYSQRNMLQEEVTKLQENYSSLQMEINEKIALGQNVSILYEKLGMIDSLIVEKGDKINVLNDIILKKSNKLIISVPGLESDIKERYNTSEDLRKFLLENDKLKPATLCLKAPEIEKEIDGKCYTKYYSGQVILIPVVEEKNVNVIGSLVAVSVSAPLTVQVRCKEKSSSNKILFFSILFILLIVLILIIKKIVNLKRKPF